VAEGPSRSARKEKAFSQARDALSEEQRAQPWVRIEKNYVFDAPSGKKTLSDLFDGRSQLFVKHFIMEPGQQQCVGCSFTVDHVASILPHLENHDVSYVAVARADRRDRGAAQAHGLALSVRVVLRQRLPLRFQRLVHARAGGGKARVPQFP
jgi:predicted dithiol-disulfide oxidoreductase (DUF899 family)